MRSSRTLRKAYVKLVNLIRAFHRMAFFFAVVVVTTVFTVALLLDEVLVQLALAPFLIYCFLVGLPRVPKRIAIRACCSPSMLLFLFLLLLWVRSDVYTSYCLLSIGENRFIGGYLFDNVFEIGVYKHDPVGLAYARGSLDTEEAHHRFRTVGGTTYDHQYYGYDELRRVPVVEGILKVGRIYRSRKLPQTPGPFYYRSAQWPWSAYSATCVGFHNGVLCLPVLVLFLVRIRYWVRYGRRLRNGICVCCGYDLRGNPGGICSECGTSFNPKLWARSGNLEKEAEAID